MRKNVLCSILCFSIMTFNLSAHFSNQQVEFQITRLIAQIRFEQKLKESFFKYFPLVFTVIAAGLLGNYFQNKFIRLQQQKEDLDIQLLKNEVAIKFQENAINMMTPK